MGVVIQNTNNLSKLYQTAKNANKELKEVTEAFAAKTNGKAGYRPLTENNGLKSKQRTLEKIEGEYRGKVEKVLDIAGSKVIYNSVEDLYNALNKFANEFDIVKFKDRIQNPLPNGYRDILMNIKMKNGHIVEFRLHLKEMDEAAKVGHKIYEQRRTLEAIGKKRELKVEELKLIYQLQKQEKFIYENAWGKIKN